MKWLIECLCLLTHIHDNRSRLALARLALYHLQILRTQINDNNGELHPSLLPVAYMIHVWIQTFHSIYQVEYHKNRPSRVFNQGACRCPFCHPWAGGTFNAFDFWSIWHTFTNTGCPCPVCAIRLSPVYGQANIPPSADSAGPSGAQQGSLNPNATSYVPSSHQRSTGSRSAPYRRVLRAPSPSYDITIVIDSPEGQQENEEIPENRPGDNPEL